MGRKRPGRRDLFGTVPRLSRSCGLGHLGDGRGFALLDYDRDGWLDVALISTNKPRFQLFRNQLGVLFPGNKVRRLKLVGSQKSSSASRGKTNLDGIGAKIWVYRKSGGRELLQHQMGQGNVAQNSSWVWLAQPKDNPAVRLEIDWPSGRKSKMTLDEKTDDVVIREPVVAGPF